MNFMNAKAKKVVLVLTPTSFSIPATGTQIGDLGGSYRFLEICF